MRCILILTTCLAALTAGGANPPPGAELPPTGSNQALFALLDLSRPDLAAVKAAVAKEDWGAARHALADHFRTRPSPHWEIDPRASGRNPRHREAEAEKALTHRFNSLGIDWQFGDSIDWSFNPTTQPDSKWPRNHEWTWQFNRHTAWVSLARAFYETGEEKYARELAVELKSWVRDCPVPVTQAANIPRSRWRTIEAGIRAGTMWPEIFPRVLAAQAFDDDALLAMVGSYADHGRYLQQFHTHGNWLTMEANGLYHAGALFPEFKDATLWRDTAAARLFHELDEQVYPDGAQIELAPGYHGVTIHNFLGPVKLTAATGFALPAAYLPKLEKMFAYFLYSMQPDRRTAPLNDSAANNVLPSLQEAARLFPQRQDFLWAASGGAQGQPPDHASHEFPYAGQFILRSGWGEKDAWVCMDGGPFGFGHQHEDKLSVILTAFGRPLLVEGGTYTYDASQWRRYVLSSRAHNLVLVDGLEQNRRKEPKETYVVKAPLPHVWETTGTFDHVAARYDEGWGPDALRLVRHTRHLFFLKPDLFIIADELEPLDGKPHTYEALFHLDAPEAVVDALQVTTRASGPNLAVTAFGADSVKIVKGQTEPVVQGWLPDHGTGYGGIKPIPTAIFAKATAGPVTIGYALCPSATAATNTVRSLTVTGNTLTVQMFDGTRREVKFVRAAQGQRVAHGA